VNQIGEKVYQGSAGFTALPQNTLNTAIPSKPTKPEEHSGKPEPSPVKDNKAADPSNHD